MSKKLAAAPFLTKTYEMIEDPLTNDVISWGESGNTFVVLKQLEFSRDLLPKFFKHNNFSSFVRQLNTYGFRKTVSEKWEFAQENFKKGEIELLPTIKRRKTQSPAVVRSVGVGKNSPSSSAAEDMGSTSTGSVDRSDLSIENKRLKMDNEKLTVELALVKKKCEELLAYLQSNLNIGADEINRILGKGTDGSSHDTDNDDDNMVRECGKGLKLFGVWLKGEEGKDKVEMDTAKGSCHKRGREDPIDGANNEFNAVV